MKYLIFCSCGHSLEHHGNEGCAGTSSDPCRCGRDAAAALESAVALVNDEALTAWRTAAEGGEAESA